jgi:hypothetical protein
MLKPPGCLDERARLEVKESVRRLPGLGLFQEPFIIVEVTIGVEVVRHERYIDHGLYLKS